MKQLKPISTPHNKPIKVQEKTQHGSGDGSWFRWDKAEQVVGGAVREMVRGGAAIPAAFEQGDWLTELDLPYLGEALQRNALTHSGYDDTSFDVMVGIADLLESDHGWSTEQSEAWFDRMGLWEEDFWGVRPTNG